MQPSGGPGPGPMDTRNLIIFFVLMMVVMFAWDFFFSRPQREKLQAEQARIEEQQKAEAPSQAAAPPAPLVIPREEALTNSAATRVEIAPAANAAPDHGVDGSIQLRGARFDDLKLRGYRTSLEDGAPEVTLLSPRGGEFGLDAFMGWQDRNPAFIGIGEEDLWTATEGARLTPDTPLELSIATSDGLEVRRTIALDADYMFTITDVVRNASGDTREIRPFGVVRRQGMPEAYVKNGIVHQGMVGAFGPEHVLQETSYENAVKHARKKARGEAGADTRILEREGQGGWLGVTDHYWLAAIALDANERMSGFYDARQAEEFTDFRAAYTGAWRSLAAGESVTYTQRLFAGAKRVDILRDYEKDLGLPKFDEAVDWGMFWFLTRPLFALLDFMGKFAGNFGVGILLSTIVIRTLTFPLVIPGIQMGVKMRKVAPQMKEIQERFAADKQRQQQEILKLYQSEKVNPVTGCVPMLLQIPVFWALYKTLTVTIEMRHEPFFGWIHDLSAKDPTSLFNLFGLLPYDPTAIPLIGAFLAIGVWPIFYGATMSITQAMSPPPTDPVQAQIFRWLPVLFTFLFAGLAAGLVIYYTWSNIITAIQQYVIMRRQGVETQLDTLIKKWRARSQPGPAE